MAIRPIDMQTNMSQVTEVGKDAQARMDAVVGQQQGLKAVALGVFSHRAGGDGGLVGLR